MNIHFNELVKWKKRSIAFLSDMIMSIIAWIGAGVLSSCFILELIHPTSFSMIILMQSFIYVMCGLYRGIWRFASIPDLVRIVRAVIIGTTVNLIVLNLYGLHLPFNIYIIYSLLLMTMLSGTRIFFRWFRDYKKLISHGKKILVVGAGSAGEGLIRDLKRSFQTYKYTPVAFVDDDPNRLGCEVQGVRVLGTCKDIANLVAKHNIELILIAMPSASSARMREIVQYCSESSAPFRTLPSLKDIADGAVKISAIRDVQIEDLLGREEIYHDWDAIKLRVQNKIILVTGGGGSIGAELCRQIGQLSPAKLIIVDNNEFNLYTIDMELRERLPNSKIETHLCNVTDVPEIQKIFALHKPNLVFHVAAYKHVPLLETHTRVAMHNNIIGTKIVAELADTFHANTFVLISTDKAVNPTSLMGATKRASEIFCQTFNSNSATEFITVRFGNVLDSAGSVIPLFRKQLLNGGPITVTHPDITRYFMTIPEAAQLILQATTMNNQGDIFVLDMGEPIKIRYLAEQMIKLSGKMLGRDIEIEFTGLRPGEKLYEELFHFNEDICATTHPKIKQAKVRHYDWKNLIKMMNEIIFACDTNDEIALKNLLFALIPEYEAHQNKNHIEEERTTSNTLTYSLELSS